MNTMREKNAVRNFYNDNKEKFGTIRQASKFLNQYGKVYKEETKIDLAATTRGNVIPEQTPRSLKNKDKKKNKK